MQRNKAFGLCGILAPLVVFVFISVSIIISPWFSLTTNVLSDLGVTGVSPLIFNGGLIVAGILCFMFSLSYRRESPVGYMLLIGAVSLMGIGIFPKTISPLHTYLAVLFSVLMTLSMLVTGILNRGSARHLFLLLAVVSLMPWLPFIWVGVTAMSQVISYACFGVFFVFLGFRMVKK